MLLHAEDLKARLTPEQRRRFGIHRVTSSSGGKRKERSFRRGAADLVGGGRAARDANLRLWAGASAVPPRSC
jgi:hypothetical protein